MTTDRELLELAAKAIGVPYKYENRICTSLQDNDTLVEFNMPTAARAAPLAGDEIPVLVGERMAKTAGLVKGSLFTIQWRDARGTFDARDASSSRS